MSKYVNNQQYARSKHPVREGVINGFAQGLQNFAEAYVEGQQREKDQELIAKMNDPNLSSMERAQIALQLSPKGQKAVMTAMDLYRKLAHQQEQERLHQEELDIKRQRERRLNGQNTSKDLEKSYKARLSDIKEQLKDTYDPKAKKLLQDEQASLQKELGQNLARLKKGESPRFDVLAIEQEPLPAQRQGYDTMNQMGGVSTPQNVSRNATALKQQEPQVQQGTGNVATPTTTQPQRVRWDKTNPEHSAFAAEVYKSTGNDRAKTNAILAEKFEK